MKQFTSVIEEFAFMWEDEELFKEVLDGHKELERLFDICTYPHIKGSLGPIRMDHDKSILFITDAGENVIPVIAYEESLDRTIFDFIVDDGKHYILIRSDYLPDEDAKHFAEWYIGDHMHVEESTVELLSSGYLSDGSVVALLECDIK